MKRRDKLALAFEIVWFLVSGKAFFVFVDDVRARLTNIGIRI